MAEHDAFEGRLRAAIVRHVADGPTEFDALGFARMVAAKEPRQPRLAAAIAWHRLAFPRTAWVVVLAATLLAALVGAMLIAGAQPQRRLPAVVPAVGQLLACPAGSTPDAPGPVGQVRPPLESPVAMAFDRRAGRLLSVVGTETGTETWTFDVCTNTWTQMHPNPMPPGVESGLRVVYDVDSDRMVGVFSGMVWSYDLESDTWTTEKTVAPTGATLWVHDPVSGLVVASANGALWNYDVETDTWTSVRQSGRATSDSVVAGVFAYDASVNRIIWYTRGTTGAETWLFDLRTGTWSRSGVAAPVVVSGMGAAPAIEYDQATKRTAVFGNGRLAAYDATVDRWEILVGNPDPAMGGFVFGPSARWLLAAYDPLNERLVGLGDAGTVAAFDAATRRWTDLLEAIAGRTWHTGDTPGLGVWPPPASAPDLEAMLPSAVDSVKLAKVSAAGGIPQARLGKGGWGTVPLASEGLDATLSMFGKTLADLDIAIATPADPSQADTFAIAFRVKGADMAGFALDLANLSGIGPGRTFIIGGKQVQVLREASGMGFDLYVKGDVVFYVFTDGMPLAEEILAALP
jgi:hypothetical protein